MSTGFIDPKTPLEVDWLPDFLKAIHNKTKLRLTFHSKQNGEALIRFMRSNGLWSGKQK